MAFQARNLSVLAYANGFTLWHYTTPDATAEVVAPGYFDRADEMLRVGDLILTNVDTDDLDTESGQGPAATILAVRVSAAASVEVAALATTDARSPAPAA